MNLINGRVPLKKGDHYAEVYPVDAKDYLLDGYEEVLPEDPEAEALDSTQSRPIPFQTPDEEAGYAQTSARVRRKGR